jgi:hypothetical protein
MADTGYTTWRNGEGMLTKAKRLVAEGAVTDQGDGKFAVTGDTTQHTLRFSKNPERPDIDCSCKASAFGRGCAHRFAVELYLSKERVA